MSVEQASLKEIAAQVRTCQLCRLTKTRTRAVPGEGRSDAEVMFIGEGPGYKEDQEGRPFVGPAGTFLTELLGIAGLERAGVFITNVVKCRPPNNRDPMPDEMAACAPYLELQLARIDPSVIVTLGRFSMTRFFPGERISQIHGTARLMAGRLCVAMYHPAAGLHQTSLADVIRDDFRKLPTLIQQARLMKQPARPLVEERLVEAAQARNEVVAESATAIVLEEAVAYAADAAENVFPVADTAPTPVPLREEIGGADRRSTKKAGRKKSAYKQMSFYDL